MGVLLVYVQFWDGFAQDITSVYFECFGSISLSGGKTRFRFSHHHRHIFLISLRMQLSRRLILVHLGPHPRGQTSSVFFR